MLAFPTKVEDTYLDQHCDISDEKKLMEKIDVVIGELQNIRNSLAQILSKKIPSGTSEALSTPPNTPLNLQLIKNALEEKLRTARKHHSKSPKPLEVPDDTLQLMSRIGIETKFFDEKPAIYKDRMSWAILAVLANNSLHGTETTSFVTFDEILNETGYQSGHFERHFDRLQELLKTTQWRIDGNKMFGWKLVQKEN